MPSREIVDAASVKHTPDMSAHHGSFLCRIHAVQGSVFDPPMSLVREAGDQDLARSMLARPMLACHVTELHHEHSEKVVEAFICVVSCVVRVPAHQVFLHGVFLHGVFLHARRREFWWSARGNGRRIRLYVGGMLVRRR